MSVQAHVTCRQLRWPPETPSTLILLLLSPLAGTCQGPGGAADGSSGHSLCQEIHGFQLGSVPFHLGAGIIITHPRAVLVEPCNRFMGLDFLTLETQKRWNVSLQ